MRFEVEGYGPPDSAALTAAGMSAAFASDSDHFVAASGRLLTAHRKGAEWIRRTPEAGYDRCVAKVRGGQQAAFKLRVGPPTRASLATLQEQRKAESSSVVYMVRRPPPPRELVCAGGDSMDAQGLAAPAQPPDCATARLSVTRKVTSLHTLSAAPHLAAGPAIAAEGAHVARFQCRPTATAIVANSGDVEPLTALAVSDEPGPAAGHSGPSQASSSSSGKAAGGVATYATQVTVYEDSLPWSVQRLNGGHDSHHSLALTPQILSGFGSGTPQLSPGGTPPPASRPDPHILCAASPSDGSASTTPTPAAPRAAASVAVGMALPEPARSGKGLTGDEGGEDAGSIPDAAWHLVASQLTLGGSSPCAHARPPAHSAVSLAKDWEWGSAPSASLPLQRPASPPLSPQRGRPKTGPATPQLLAADSQPSGQPPAADIQTAVEEEECSEVVKQTGASSSLPSLDGCSAGPGDAYGSEQHMLSGLDHLSYGDYGDPASAGAGSTPNSGSVRESQRIVFSWAQDRDASQAPMPGSSQSPAASGSGHSGSLQLSMASADAGYDSVDMLSFDGCGDGAGVGHGSGTMAAGEAAGDSVGSLPSGHGSADPASPAESLVQPVLGEGGQKRDAMDAETGDGAAGTAHGTEPVVEGSAGAGDVGPTPTRDAEAAGEESDTHTAGRAADTVQATASQRSVPGTQAAAATATVSGGDAVGDAEVNGKRAAPHNTDIESQGQGAPTPKRVRVEGASGASLAPLPCLEAASATSAKEWCMNHPGKGNGDKLPLEAISDRAVDNAQVLVPHWESLAPLRGRWCLRPCRQGTMGVRLLYYAVCKLLKGGELPLCNACMTADSVELYCFRTLAWRLWRMLCVRVPHDILAGGTFELQVDGELRPVVRCAHITD